MPAYVFAAALGPCTLRWENERLTGFGLPEPGQIAPDEPIAAPAWIEALAARVRDHLAGRLQDFADVSYDFDRVSSFQRAVYTAALAVKPGQTISYGALAAAIGQPPGASRAVGTALGQNPWPLLVPCHRFVGADGHMTGFSGPGGIKTKLRLLALEGAELFAE